MFLLYLSIVFLKFFIFLFLISVYFSCTSSPAIPAKVAPATTVFILGLYMQKDGIKNHLVYNSIFIISNYFIASSTATATATDAPTIGLLPIPINPIIST